MSRVDDNEHLPPWLRDVPLPPQPLGMMDRPAQPSMPSAAQGSAPLPEEAAIPEWLRDLGADQPIAPAADLGGPAWLGGVAGDRSADRTPESEVPEWLRGAAEERPAEPAPASELPEWLRGEQPAAALPTENAVPEWLRGAAEERPAEPAPASELPEWLRGEQPAAALPTENAVPEWLRDTPQEQRPAEPAPASELPEWLRGEQPAAALPTENAVPEWLRGAAEERPAEPAPASELPEWLRGEQPAAALPTENAAPEWLGDTTSPVASAPSPRAEELPSWLRDEKTTGGPASKPPRTGEVARDQASDDTGIPEWLRDIPDEEIRKVMEEDEEAEITVEPFSFEGASPSRTAPPADAPGWLANIVGEKSAEPETMPSWLEEQTSQTAGPTDVTPVDADVPAWLRGIDDEIPAAPASPTTGGGAPQPPSTSEPPAPSWLQETGMAQAPAETPAWLRAEAPADRGEAPAREPAAEEGLPAWLRAEAPADRGETPAREPAAEEGLPAWLRAEVGAPLSPADTPGEAGLPSWLRGAAAETPAPAEEAVPSFERPTEEPAVAPEQPAPQTLDWFADQAPPVEEPAPAAAESEFFGGAELPPWLRAPEPEPTPEISPADARSLDWLKRLGVTEEDVTNTVAAPAPKLPPPAPPTRTPAQIEALGLLQRLAAEPFPEAMPTPVPAPAPFWRRISVERLLYILLLAILIAALAMPSLSANLQAPPVTPGVGQLFERLNGLSENDTVLVGYEWDARRISELRPLEQAVLGHLIERKVKLVLISTDPQGTLLLFDLRDQLSVAGYQAGGQDYIVLGYKPGGELALRTLARDFQGVLRSDFQGNDATRGVLASGLRTGTALTALGDLSMFLVLADDAGDVQSWMEQIHSRAPQVPLNFLLPAEAQPIVQPYMRQPGVMHLAGKQDALAYQQLRGVDVQRLAREAGQERLAMLIFGALFVMGAIVVGIGGLLDRRRKAP